MKTWTIVYTDDDGKRQQLDVMTEREARALHADTLRVIDPQAELVDLMAKALATFPVGEKVRHITTKAVGVVEEVDIDFAGNAVVGVRWDGGRFDHYLGDYLAPEKG